MTGTGGQWAKVRNLGPVSVEQLATVGITTPEQLSTLGIVETYVRLKQAYPNRINKTMLWALAGAELDIDWRDVPAQIKDQLEAELSEREPHAG